MYCLRVKILTLVTIGYIVGFIVGMYMEYCLWAQVAVLDIYCIYWTVWDRYMQVLYLGRAPRTKETLPDFLKWRRVTRHPLVFRGLTSSQRTPGFWGVTHLPLLQIMKLSSHITKVDLTHVFLYELCYEKPRLLKPDRPSRSNRKNRGSGRGLVRSNRKTR